MKRKADLSKLNPSKLFILPFHQVSNTNEEEDRHHSTSLAREVLNRMKEMAEYSDGDTAKERASYCSETYVTDL